MGRSLTKISNEGKTVDTVEEENNMRRKDKVVFPTGGGESTKPKNVEALYVYVQSWVMEEKYNIPFTSWKGVDKYQDLVAFKLLSASR